MKATEILRQEYGTSRNFMTPRVIRRTMVSTNVAVELSTGDGLGGCTIWGVSFVRRSPHGDTRRSRIASAAFPSRRRAEDRIDRVRDLLRIAEGMCACD